MTHTVIHHQISISCPWNDEMPWISPNFHGICHQMSIKCPFKLPSSSSDFHFFPMDFSRLHLCHPLSLGCRCAWGSLFLSNNSGLCYGDVSWYTLTCIYTYIHVYIITCNTYIYNCIYNYIYKYMYIYIQHSIYTIYTYMYNYVYIYMCIHIYVIWICIWYV